MKGIGDDRTVQETAKPNFGVGFLVEEVCGAGD